MNKDGVWRRRSGKVKVIGAFSHVSLSRRQNFDDEIGKETRERLVKDSQGTSMASTWRAVDGQRHWFWFWSHD